MTVTRSCSRSRFDARLTESNFQTHPVLLVKGESLYEETVGNLRKEVEFYLRKFESLLDNQDKNDISLAAKEIKEKFEAISNSIKCY